MQYSVIENKIIHFKSAIPNIQEFLDFFNKNHNSLITEWLPWNEVGGYDQKRYFRDYGYSKSIYSSQCYKYKDNPDYLDTVRVLENFIYYVDTAWNQYVSFFDITSPKNNQSDFCILKYHEYSKNPDSSELGPHVDHPDPNNTGEHTMLIYYNDDYIGGEIIFPEIQKTLKPKAGDIITFSSVDPELIHYTKTVTEGSKIFTLNLWQDGATKGFYNKDHNKSRHNLHLNGEKKNLLVCPSCKFWGDEEEFGRI